MHRTQGWLNPDEATSYLGLPSRRALYERCRRGQLPAHRWGRSLRFLAEELDAAVRGDAPSAERSGGRS